LSGSNRGNTFRLPFSNILKTSVLINQRCRLVIILSKCVATHVVCECRPTLPSALAYTRTHSLSLSRSLRVTVFFSFHIKTYLSLASIISEIQDSIVFGCSHFIGSLYSSRDRGERERDVAWSEFLTLTLTAS